LLKLTPRLNQHSSGKSLYKDGFCKYEHNAKYDASKGVDVYLVTSQKLQRAWNNRAAVDEAIKDKTTEALWNSVVKDWNFGSFHASIVAADATTSGLVFRETPPTDETWAFIGDGTKKGLGIPRVLLACFVLISITNCPLGGEKNR
jgi:hypothetical protein